MKMTSQFENLYTDLKAATGELFPEIPNFARRAARDEIVRMAMLTNSASKVDRILSGFLGLTAIDERGKTAERISCENYMMFVAMAEKCEQTLLQISAAILSAEREEIEEIKKLKWLQKFFRYYRQAIDVDVDAAFENFKETVGQNLGRRLSAEMAKKDVSIVDLAKELNFAPITIRHYLVGDRTPTAETLYQFSVFFWRSSRLFVGVGERRR